MSFILEKNLEETGITIVESRVTQHSCGFTFLMNLDEMDCPKCGEHMKFTPLIGIKEEVDGSS
jgi:rubrerythrin